MFLSLPSLNQSRFQWFRKVLSSDLTSKRKQDHIDLSFKSQVGGEAADSRFYYEPMLTGHRFNLPEFSFSGMKLGLPLWVSSMTGGTEQARIINARIARACRKFRMGFGLGSCRIILEDDQYLPDFDWRHEIGDDLPFYANLGIAQVEHLLENQKGIDKIKGLVDKLSATGLIVHVNPLQEWLQPEGDEIEHPPVDTISRLLDKVNFPVMVKEVGQGFGPESMKALLSLPLEAIEFGAHGGTNFAKLELLRHENGEISNDPTPFIGHTAEEMTAFANTLAAEALTRQLIISGGVKNFLDGFYLINRVKAPLMAVYGQASGVLRHATVSEEALDNYLNQQKRGLQMAYAFLKLKEEQ